MMKGRGRRYTIAVSVASVLTAAPLAGQVVHVLPAEDRALSGTPQDVFSIGVLDGRPWEELSGVRAVDFDAEGNLYVLDGGSRVLKFGPDGDFVRQIGRKGRGPGEIDLPLTMAVADDGTVVVVDPSAGHHVFAPDGEYERTIRPSTPAFGARAVLVDGALVVPGGNLASMQAGRAGRGLPLLHQPLSDGAETTVIYEADVPTIESSVAGADGGEATFTLRRPPLYSPTLRIAPAGSNTVAVASGTDWAIDVLTASGEPVVRVERPITGRPSGASDRRVVEERMREAAAERGGALSFGSGAPDAVRRSRGGVDIAETIPAIRSLRGDGAGLVFVARETDPVGGEEPLIDVVRVDGTYVGTLRGESLPSAFGPDRLAAFVEIDDVGVERVVVRRLPVSWLGS